MVQQDKFRPAGAFVGRRGHRAGGLRCGAGLLAQAERSSQAAGARVRKGVVPS